MGTAPYDGYGGDTWADSKYWNCLNYSDRMVEPADIIRLKSLRLDYDITRWLKKIRLSGGSVGVSGENLWYWAANRDGLDPDTVWEDYFGIRTQLSDNPARVVFNLNINF